MNEWTVRAGLYAMELFALILMLSLYRLGPKPWLSAFSISFLGGVRMVAGGLIAWSRAFAVREGRVGPRARATGL